MYYVGGGSFSALQWHWHGGGVLVCVVLLWVVQTQQCCWSSAPLSVTAGLRRVPPTNSVLWAVYCDCWWRIRGCAAVFRIASNRALSDTVKQGASKAYREADGVQSVTLRLQRAPIRKAEWIKRTEWRYNEVLLMKWPDSEYWSGLCPKPISTVANRQRLHLQKMAFQQLQKQTLPPSRGWAQCVNATGLLHRFGLSVMS